MRWNHLLVVVMAMLLALLVVRGVPPANAGQVSCAEIMHQVNHQISASHGRKNDTAAMAKTIGTTTPWIEHCMHVYGRRPKRAELESGEAREERLEKFETDDVEETASEDKEEEGARERHEHPEKSRVGRNRLRPTILDENKKDEF